jgi:hypothetical protein
VPRLSFAEAAEAIKAGARMLLVEPLGHLREEEFKDELEAAAQAGLEVEARPPIRGSHTAILRKAG